MIRLFTFGLALVFASGIAFGQSSPPGTQGKDWDRTSFEIKNNVVVNITGQVSTTNERSGNTSSIILYIDGIERMRRGGDRAQHTLNYRISENGNHDVLVVCSNTQADADVCVLNVARGGMQKFE